MKIQTALAAIFFVSASAMAADLGKYDKPGYTITITDEACTHQVILNLTRPDFRPQLKAGSIVAKSEQLKQRFGKDKVQMCYLLEDGVVYSMDELGLPHSSPRAEYR